MDLAGAYWRKSSRSGGGTNANCVEVAVIATGAALRDTKNQDGPTLLLPGAGWDALRAHLTR